MLGEVELNKLIFDIQDKIVQEITYANRCGESELKEVLEKYGFYEDKKESNPYIDLRSAKILIIGNLLVGKNIADMTAKKLGIDPDRIEYIPFENATNYNYES